MATNQLLMLEDINMEYHAFRQNQVLTHTQLNELINFFEDQDRLSRTHLMGVGIYNGFETEFDNLNKTIKISRGCGITTDGDLLLLEQDTVFRFYIEYKNLKDVTGEPVYNPFYITDVSNETKQVELWEILPQQNPTSAKNLNQFNSATNRNLADMAVIAYIEYYRREPDKCTSISCDNQGEKQISHTRFLLISKTDLNILINKEPETEKIYDSIYKPLNQAASEYFNLPFFKARRFIPDTLNTSSPEALKKQYATLFESDLEKLVTTIKELQAKFNFILNYNKTIDFDNIQIDIEKLRLYNFQYIFDFYKDLVDAYNELHDVLFDCIYICWPEKFAFPKHLMLGEVVPSASESKVKPYRHVFYPSPNIYNIDLISKCRFLFARLVGLLEKFDIAEMKKDIRIVPSLDYTEPLGNRAIPYYYKGADQLVKIWNYEFSKRGKQKNILGYNISDYKTLKESPLDYDTDAYNFYRIEGHIGHELTFVLEEIIGTRELKNLPFEVVAVSFENKAGNLNLDDYECYFNDLDALISNWEESQKTLYSKAIRFFSKISPNKNIPTKFETIRAAERVDKLARLTITTGEKTSNKVKKEDSISEFYNEIDKSDDTIGSRVKELFESTDKIKGMDLSLELEKGLSKENIFTNQTEDENSILAIIPAGILGFLLKIYAMFPITLADLNATTVNNYKKLLTEFEEFLNNKIKTAGKNIESNKYTRQGFEDLYMYLVSELWINAGTSNQLSDIYNELIARKQKILNSLTLKEFINYHPGLEHKAGVHRGGTFVIAYTSKRVINKKLFEDQLNKSKGNAGFIKTDNAEFDEKINKLLFSDAFKDLEEFIKYLAKNYEKVDLKTEITRYLKEKGLKPSSTIFKKAAEYIVDRVMALVKDSDDSTIEESGSVVVADFCLPYMFNSSYPPVNYILPRREYLLLLPKSAVCNQEPLMEFKKEPVDGTVRATAGFENTIVIKDGSTWFDASKIAEADLGKEISFTIDHQVTNCKIMVYKHPKASFTAKITAEDNTKFTLELTNTSDDNTGTTYTYNWEFGDGSKKTLSNKEKFTVDFDKQLLDKLGISKTIKVKLTAINGVCTHVAESSVDFTPIVKISLKLPKSSVCVDSVKLIFEVLPSTGVVASDMEPSSIEKSGSLYYFIPANVETFRKPISFTVDSVPTDCKITVFEHPFADFEEVHEVKENILYVTIINKTTPKDLPGLKFDWVFSDGTKHLNITNATPFQDKFNIEDLKKAGLSELKITLTAKTELCSGVTSKVILLSEVSPQIECPGYVKAEIEKDITALSAIKITDPEQIEIRKALISLMKKAAEAVTGNNNTARLVVMNQIAENLHKAISALPETEKNTLILAPLVRIYIQLAMHLVRCPKEISSELEVALNEKVLEVFMKDIYTISQKMPNLNKGNILVTFCTNFLENFQSKNASITTAIKIFIKNIQKYFKV